MSSHSPFHLGGVLRNIRSFLPRSGNSEEKFNFVRFTDETELNTLSNGSISKEGTPGDEKGGSLEYTNGSVAKLEDQSDEGAQARQRNQISALQAGWNVTNAIQGMFIVSFPYAVLQGGYWALVAMVVVAYICCHTGKILVECLYEVNQDGVKVRVRDSYVAIAEECWGKNIGGRLVNIAQMIELLMTCILYVLLCGDLMIGSFPESPIDLSSWIMISTVFLLPCAFLKDLRHVSWLSFWCTMAHMCINGIIIIYCLTKAAEWKWSEVQVKIDIWTFPISLGIVVFSYTSQIFLPTLEGNMVDKSQFHCMMHWTHIAAAVFKALFSYIGFLTWGFATQEVITNNMPTPALKIIVNLILVVKALLSYPLPYFAAVDLLETALFQGKPTTLFPTCSDYNHSLKVWAVTLRLLLVVFTMVLAIFIPHFAILMGLIGSFTGTMLSFVWPCVFHMIIKRGKLKWYTKATNIFVILLGLFFGSIGMYYSAHALIRAFHGLPPRPGTIRPVAGAGPVVPQDTHIPKLQPP